MRKTNAKMLFGLSLAVTLSFSACAQNQTLKDAFKDHFYIGVALNEAQSLGKKAAETAIIKEQFNSITPENCMKWERIHPMPNEYRFALADSFVALGERNHMFMIGHCMVWHAQTPDWVFQDSLGKPLTRDALLKRMHDHILTVIGRYKGRIQGYDVVNEALTEEGQMRKSKWFEIIGEDYVEKAFEYAKEADPNAELYYNDYNIEMPAKCQGAVKLIKNLQAKGIKVTGVGIQGHYHMNSPSLKNIDQSLSEYSKLGVKVMFTEVDINVLPSPENLSGADVSQKFELTKEMNPYPTSLPDSMQQKLANRYADFFKIFLKYKNISRVTFWGLEDGHSWLNGWPIPGRTNYPLLFDRNLQPKAAFYSIIKTAK